MTPEKLKRLSRAVTCAAVQVGAEKRPPEDLFRVADEVLAADEILDTERLRRIRQAREERDGPLLERLLEKARALTREMLPHAPHVCTVCHRPGFEHSERCERCEDQHWPALCCDGCDCGSFERVHPEKEENDR